MGDDLTPYRVLVTGSRDWADEDAVADDLVQAWRAASTQTLVVVHGHCPTGADAIADLWVRAMQMGCFHPTPDAERHPAAWRPAGQYNSAAGFERNAEMVALGADRCLAYLNPCVKTTCRKPRPHDSHGATHCADLAERAGIPTLRRRSW